MCIEQVCVCVFKTFQVQKSFTEPLRNYVTKTLHSFIIYISNRNIKLPLYFYYTPYSTFPLITQCIFESYNHSQENSSLLSNLKLLSLFFLMMCKSYTLKRWCMRIPCRALGSRRKKQVRSRIEEKQLSQSTTVNIDQKEC